LGLQRAASVVTGGRVSKPCGGKGGGAWGSGQGPAGRVIGHAEVRVIVDGGWSCEEDEDGIGAGGGVGAGEEFAAEALVGFVDGEIGEVAGVAEIGEGAGDADELAAEASGDEEVGVAEHAFESVLVGDGAALGEAGPFEYVGEFCGRQGGFVEKDDVGHGLRDR